MKLRLPKLLRRKKETPKEPAVEEQVQVPREKVIYRRVRLEEDIPRYRTEPTLIFVGSSKGGVGKSFIAANLTVIATVLSNKNVYAVDLDVDNYSLSMTLQPPDTTAIYYRLRQSKIDDYLNVATIFHQGIVPRYPYLKVKTQTFACNGVQLTGYYRLVPTYSVAKEKVQRTILQQLDLMSLRQGLEALIDHFEELKGEKVIIFDGKQKSSLGIEFEPLYRLLTERAHVFLLVTEPPYLSFTDITSQYRNVLNKTIIIVNKVDIASHADKLAVLVRDSLAYGVPVFMIPKVPEDETFHKERLMAPAAQSLTRRTAIHILALAYFLNIISDELLEKSGCADHVRNILTNLKKLYSHLAT